MTRSDRRRAARNRGFTIVELMIVAAVLAALIAVAIPIYRGYRERALISRATAEIRMLAGAIDVEVFEKQKVPDDISHLIEGDGLDPWGNPYVYRNVSPSAPKKTRGLARKDKNLVPINSDYDLYSVGPDGDSKAPLTAKASHDDIIRANDGAYVGVAEDY